MSECKFKFEETIPSAEAYNHLREKVGWGKLDSKTVFNSLPNSLYCVCAAVKRSYIGVFAGKGLEGFYGKFGFWKRHTGHMGPGMMHFWEDAEINHALR